MGSHKTNIYEQNPVCNGYYDVSDLPEVLASECKCNFGPGNIDWFVDEFIHFKDTNIEINMNEENGNNFSNAMECWLCE